MSFADLGRVLVVIPTYNEAANLETVLARLRAAVPEADVLVVDDSSPDGTGAIADRLAAADGGVHVLHRTEKAGLGIAYIAGFRWALSAGYDAVVEMDADGSHPPEQLPDLLARIDSSAGCSVKDSFASCDLRPHGFRVLEVPITFTEREVGQSKMSRAIVTEALWRVAVWGLTSRSRSARARALAARS